MRTKIFPIVALLSASMSIPAFAQITTNTSPGANNSMKDDGLFNFRDWDVDGNGDLTNSEFTANGHYTNDQFSKADSNQDGRISNDEFTAWSSMYKRGGMNNRPYGANQSGRHGSGRADNHKANNTSGMGSMNPGNGKSDEPSNSMSSEGSGIGSSSNSSMGSGSTGSP